MPANFDSIHVFTDRNAEIAVFDSFWEEDNKWILFFHGESGIGKSLLIDWLIKNRSGESKDKIWVLKIDLRSDDSVLCENIPRLVKKIVNAFSRLDDKAYQRSDAISKSLEAHLK
jgi:ABC-type ATPase involved in cell division